MSYLKTQLKVFIRSKEHPIILILILLSIFFLFLYNSQESKEEAKYIHNAFATSLKEYEYLTVTDCDVGSDQNLHKNFTNTKTNSEIPGRHYDMTKALENQNVPFLLNDELESLRIYQRDSDRAERLSHHDGKVTAEDVPFQASGGRIYHYLKGKEKVNPRLLRDHLKPESTRYGTSGSLFIISMLNYLTSFVGIFAVTWYGIRSVGRKYEGNQHKLFETTSIAKWKVVLSDYFVFTLNVIGFLAAALIFSIGITTIYGQKFRGNYPILVRINGKLDLISAQSYIIQIILMYLMVLSVAFFIGYLIVKIIRNNFLSAVITTLILSIGFTASILGPSDSYNPFLYFQPTRVLSGRGTEKVNDDSVWINNGGEKDYEYMLRDFTFENVKYYQAETLGYRLELHLTTIKGIIAMTLLIIMLFFFNVFPYRKLIGAFK